MAYAKGDMLYIPVNQMENITKYIGSDGRVPKINKMGGLPRKPAFFHFLFIQLRNLLIFPGSRPDWNRKRGYSVRSVWINPD